MKINVLTVPAEMRDELERRFAGRAGMVESSDGFEWFELLKPVDGTDRYLVYTRWRSEDDFQAWQQGQSFARGHAQAAADAGRGEAPGGSHGESGAQGQGHGHGRGPAATGSEVWSFEVVQSAGPKQ
ncbi:heme-degrading monooxygenase HmoA [Nonomuraea muscovyensis]|uniref:Heme-degrading monooxygenase HmoA n=1 Tax=Nonomuraea muscovyensis TaxID=1124761 RepID=A0A7X0CB24_9ACTN|nr:heme-degrading monooxygenase HmoA [Nonomuraea muscovyensis]